MSAILDDFELGVRQRRQVALRRRLRDDPVLVAPDDEGRRLHASQQMRQGLAVHVGLPRDAEAHLARRCPRPRAGRSRLGAVDLVERFLIMEAGARIVDVADDGLVEDIALGRLDAHRADENELGDVARAPSSPSRPRSSRRSRARPAPLPGCRARRADHGASRPGLERCASSPRAANVPTPGDEARSRLPTWRAHRGTRMWRASRYRDAARGPEDPCRPGSCGPLCRRFRWRVQPRPSYLVPPTSHKACSDVPASQR